MVKIYFASHDFTVAEHEVEKHKGDAYWVQTEEGLKKRKKHDWYGKWFETELEAWTYLMNKAKADNDTFYKLMSAATDEYNRIAKIISGLKSNMTTEKAIDALERLKLRSESYGLHDIDTEQAFQLAINSLKSNPTFTEEPNWSKAPRRANYYGIDGDGSRWWYEFEPTIDGNNFDQSRGDFIKDINPDRMKLFKRPEL